jgi:MFS family permease
MDIGLLRSTLSHLQIDFSKGSGLDHMIKFGHNLLWVWGVIIGTLLAIVGVSGIVGNTAVGRAIWGTTGIFTGGVASAVSAVASAIFQYFSGILQLLLLVVLVVGMIHAYVLPMIPYIMMFFVIMGMLVLVIEGMVAAPIWALFHVRPDGQEFIEQVQRPGYMILFNLILRIPLAMFGMMFSFLFIDAMMWFESVTFVPAFLGGTSDSGRGYGPIGIIAAFCMLAFLHWQVCLKAFGLITHLPDQVSRWFGQAGERMGEDQDTKTLVGGMVSRSEHKLGAVAGAGIASAAGNKAGSTPKDGGQQSDKVQPGGGLLRNQPRSVAGANTPQTPTSPRGGG